MHIMFRLRYHLIIEKIQQLIDFIQPQCGFPLFQVADKPQPYTGLDRKVLLSHIELLAQ